MATKSKTTKVLEGLNRKIDHRGTATFATVTAALAALTPSRRYIGQSAWIVDKQAVYRFGTGTNDSDFVPDKGTIFWSVN